MLALTEDAGFRGVAALRVGIEFPATLSRLRDPPPGTGLERLRKTLQTVQVGDCAGDPAYDPVRVLNPAFASVRTALHVPMQRDGKLLGAIVIYRDQVLPFDDKEIELVESFAKQAVIAIEDTRLLTETREALEQQTATAEVLQVINSSPGDLAPVFQAILEKAHSLCGVASGSLLLYDGESFRAVAAHGYVQVLTEQLRQNYRLGPNHPMRPLLGGAPFVHLSDLAEIDDPVSQNVVRLAGIRAILFVPLRKDGVLLGVFTAGRDEVRPFTDKQIALLQNFAAQAVIAMENARLITETREALEQQTATAEVLQVINSSPGDLTPVFDAILEKAHSLCGAEFGSLFLYDAEHFRAIASHGVPEALASRLREGIGNDSRASQQLIAGEPFAHIRDSALEEHAVYRGMDLVNSHRTLLSVPLRKGDALLGKIVAGRLEARPFTDKQIALLQNFAAQAVIAMENARLITETRQALEQQTATSEVLQVINSSPGNLAPVFDAMLETAVRLCDFAFAVLWVYDGATFRAQASHAAPPAYAEFLAQSPAPVTPGTAFAEIVSGADIAHFNDVADEDPSAPYGPGHPLVELACARTYLAVALRREGRLLGIISAFRQEVRPFTDKQIALLQSFAAQAVIAMENARLLTETREALEQQTATAEVLQVINSSPGDLAPVFDAMLERAIHLCDAKIGSLWTYNGDQFRLAAVRGGSQELFDIIAQSAPGYDRMSARGHALRGEHVTHVLDARESEAYLSGDPVRRAMVDVGGGRTLITVSLRKDDVLLGIFTIYRTEVRPFTDKQIALLQNFAAQAVIAMENARLITETREALEQQTATAEVLQVINSSPGDLAPVFDAMLEKRCACVRPPSVTSILTTAICSIRPLSAACLLPMPSTDATTRRTMVRARARLGCWRANELFTTSI
jgi:GAF domain-containing protein